MPSVLIQLKFDLTEKESPELLNFAIFLFVILNIFCRIRLFKI